MKPILTLCLWGTCALAMAQNDSLGQKKTQPSAFPKKVNAALGSTDNIKRYSLDSLVKLPMLNEAMTGKWEILPNTAYAYPLYITHMELRADRTFKTTAAKGPKSKETYYWHYSGNSLDVYVNDTPQLLRKLYSLKVYSITKERLELELNYSYSPMADKYVLRRVK